MSSATLVAPVDAPPRGRLQRWVIGLGWVGCGLWGLDWLTGTLLLESTAPAGVLLTYHLLEVLLGWLWPLALSLQLRRWVKPDVLRIILTGFAGLLTLPLLGWSLLALLIFTSSPDSRWQTQQVLFRRAADPTIEVVRQTRAEQFVTTYPGYRLVQLTPVLGLWQRVEPVDTTTFDETGWQRVNQ